MLDRTPNVGPSIFRGVWPIMLAGRKGKGWAPMNISILPVFVIIVFAFCIFITRSAKRNQAINTAETRSVYVLLLMFFIWTLISIAMGIKGIHASPSLRERIPLLWQTNVPVVIVVIGLLLSRTLRSALRGIASSTPWHWLGFFRGYALGRWAES